MKTVANTLPKLSNVCTYAYISMLQMWRTILCLLFLHIFQVPFIATMSLEDGSTRQQAFSPVNCLTKQKQISKNGFPKRVSLCTCIIKSNYHVLLMLFTHYSFHLKQLFERRSSQGKPRKAMGANQWALHDRREWVGWWWNHKVSQVALVFCRYTQIFTQGQHVTIVPLSRLICPFGRIKYPYWEAGQMSRKIWQKWLVSKEKSTGSSWFQHTTTWQCSLMGYRLELHSEQYTYQFQNKHSHHQLSTATPTGALNAAPRWLEVTDLASE